MNKPELAVAIANVLDVPVDDAWAANGDTITVDWHRAIGAAMGVPYQPNKPAHMAALLRKVDVEWVPSRHESHKDPLPDGDNIMKAAYEDLLDGLLASR